LAPQASRNDFRVTMGTYFGIERKSLSINA
jgi:hypothetical protein